MVEINVCPSTLLEGFATYSPAACKLLFDGREVSHVLDFDSPNNDGSDRETYLEHVGRISLSGVQPKASLIVNAENCLVKPQEYEQSTYILKPAPSSYVLLERKYCPANEHLTMQIASQVYGIKTAANGLCFTPKGKIVYITKRFDVLPDGTKMLMEDFTTVIGRNEKDDGKEFKYSGSFEDIAMAIRKYVPAWMVDMERFFELVVFNYVYANGDDHLKNFSLIKQGDFFQLAPAYDLLNTSLHVQGDDLGLDGGLSPNIWKSDVYLRTGHPCRRDFEMFGEYIGLLKSRTDRILDKYMKLPESAVELVERSYLTDKMKRYYLRIVNERITRFVRESD